MATFEEVLARARELSAEECGRLADALRPSPRPALGVLAPRGTLAGPAPQSVAWVKAERGHAVLATDTGPSDAQIPEGAEAIAGMWADLRPGGAP